MNSHGTMANSSKKRKASELDTDFNRKTTPQKPQRRRKSSKTDSKTTEEIPFRSECPYRPSTKQNDDVFVQKEEIAPGFEFEFGVRPGLLWKNMRSYRNVKLQDHTFSVGSIIYINKQYPPPKSLPSDASDADILKYDRLNFWVGRIADTRAENDKAVFLRVYWLYWPEELPMGRQSYHGDRELILSNAMDIVDAQTISGAADLVYWDEQDPNNQQVDRFWRQTLDVSKLGKDRKGGLSELRRHCVCEQPHNPDRTMFECKNSSCQTWNHEDCLIDDIGQKAWSVYEKEGSLDSLEFHSEAEETAHGDKPLQKRLLSPVKSVGKKLQSAIAPSMSAVIEQSMVHAVDAGANGTGTPAGKGKQNKKMAKSKQNVCPPWEGILKVSLIENDGKDDDSPLLAIVEQVRTKKSKTGAKSWRIRVHCLLCGQPV